jgi:NitT/TauT family transport system substrate-binding protein
MIRRLLAIAVFLVATLTAASAQDRVAVGAMRSIGNAALFLAVGNGTFKAEGLELDLKFYPTPSAVAAALAKGEIDVGASSFGPELFKLAGQGQIKLIAAQSREKKDFEGNELVASNGAYANGLRRFEDLRDRSIAVVQFGSPAHYQAFRIAQLKRVDTKGVLIRPMATPDAAAAAVSSGQVDAAILPPLYARDLLVSSEAKLIGWCSEVTETQLGGLFATAKIIANRRAVLEKFARAYQRGAADFASALMRIDKYHKRNFDKAAQTAAAVISRAVYPNASGEQAMNLMESSLYAMDPEARLDMNDIAEQFAWFKAQGLLGSEADPRNAVDPSFIR